MNENTKTLKIENGQVNGKKLMTMRQSLGESEM